MSTLIFKQNRKKQEKGDRRIILASRVEHGLNLDINLKSAALTKDNPDLIISNLRAEKEKIEDHGCRLPEGRLIKVPWDITGGIGFDLESFIGKRKKIEAGETIGPEQYVFKPMQGMMNLYPYGETALELHRRTCAPFQ